MEERDQRRARLRALIGAGAEARVVEAFAAPRIYTAVRDELLARDASLSPDSVSAAFRALVDAHALIPCGTGERAATLYRAARRLAEVELVEQKIREYLGGGKGANIAIAWDRGLVTSVEVNGQPIAAEDWRRLRRVGLVDMAWVPPAWRDGTFVKGRWLSSPPPPPQTAGKGLAEIVISSAVETITDGHVLHVRADRRPAKRGPRTPALEAVDLTVGPDARGGFLVVDYTRILSGREERFSTAEEAIRDVRRRLAWDRVVEGFRPALVAVHGKPESPDYARFAREAQIASDGRRMREFSERRPPLRGPLFGPGFGPFGR